MLKLLYTFMSNFILRALLVLLFFSHPILAVDGEDELSIKAINQKDIKSRLTALLKNRSFDKNLTRDKTTKVFYQRNQFELDNEGRFYEQVLDKKYPLEIFYDQSHPKQKLFLIFDPHQPPHAELPQNPLSTLAATLAQTNDFDDIVSVQRMYGIYSMKSKNPECYYAYAKVRLPKNPLERLLALERSDNPRPLVFESDSDWEEFKDDIKNIFSSFRGPSSFVAITGTSTTFFSENPKKGRNAPLFETVPTCIERAHDPKKSLEVYTFDTPGAEPSDIDIHVLIPELSDLCNRALVEGNNGQRIVYWENTMDKCLRLSSQQMVRDMVKPVNGPTNTLKKAVVIDKPLGQFFSKWSHKLPNRDINFSVLIRPDQRKDPLTKPSVDFRQEHYLQGKFVIPID
jgi:hypothetical protein